MSLPRWYPGDVPTDTALWRLEMDRFLNQVSADLDRRIRCPRDEDDEQPEEDGILRFKRPRRLIGGGGGSGSGGTPGGSGSPGAASGAPQAAGVEDDCEAQSSGVKIDDDANLYGVVGFQYDDSQTSNPFNTLKGSGIGTWYDSANDKVVVELAGGAVDMATRSGALTSGNLLEADGDGNAVDSGVVADDVVTQDGTLANTYFPIVDANGELTDSGYQPSDFLGGINYGGSSEADKEFLGYDGGAGEWVNKDALDLSALGNGVSVPAHTLTDEHTISTTAKAYTCPLWLEAPNNSSDGTTGGCVIGFTVQGTRSGYFGGVRGGAFGPGAQVVLDANGALQAQWSRSGSTGFYAIERQGILALKDVATGADNYSPAGSGYGHLYPVDGQLAYTDDAGNRTILTGEPGGESTLATSDGQAANANALVPSFQVTFDTSGNADKVLSGLHRTPGLMIDLQVEIDTAIPTSGGITSVRVGDDLDDDRYGVFTTFSVGTKLTFEDWTADTSPIAFGAAESGDVVFSIPVGSWDAPAGQATVYVYMTYLAIV